MPTKTKTESLAKPKTSRGPAKPKTTAKTTTAKSAPAKAAPAKAAPAKVAPTKSATAKADPKMLRNDLDFEFFHNLLLEERSRLEEERELIRASNKDLEGSMPEDSEGGEEDTADLASAIMDKEMDLSVEEELEDQLSAIDHALNKLADGTYGICDMSGEKIPEGRLKLIPWASLTVQCQAMSEGE